MNKKTSPRSHLSFILLLMLFAFPSLASCSGAKYKLQKEELVLTRQDGSSVTLVAELAVRQEERNWGYMKRKHIPDGTGMLFAFTSDQKLRFWMKDTPHPLSIAYIDSRGVIQELHDMKPFDTSDIPSSVYVRYALEVPQGWFEKVKVTPGTTITRKNGTPLKEISRY